MMPPDAGRKKEADSRAALATATAGLAGDRPRVLLPAATAVTETVVGTTRKPPPPSPAGIRQAWRDGSESEEYKRSTAGSLARSLAGSYASQASRSRARNREQSGGNDPPWSTYEVLKDNDFASRVSLSNLNLGAETVMVFGPTKKSVTQLVKDFYTTLGDRQHPVTAWRKYLDEAKKEFEILYHVRIKQDFTYNDFEFMKTLGKGAYGRVYLTRMAKSNNIYATKVIEKSAVMKATQIEHVKNEKRVLQSLNFPFCVYLEFCFKDTTYLYFVLPFVSGGEMFTILRKRKKFEERLAKFYAAQVILAFEYIHYCDLVYRDLKPENIMIDSKGYLKLTDFGFCKLIRGRTYSHCGTPEYMAPEVILSKGYGKAVDWWSYGILVYEMVAGYSPFASRDQTRIYDKVILGRFSMPKSFSADLRHLVTNILQVDLSRRFGNLRNGVEDIKEHDWFKEINFLALVNRSLTAPYIPPQQGDPKDTLNFDEYNEVPIVPKNNDPFAKEFEDF